MISSEFFYDVDDLAEFFDQADLLFGAAETYLLIEEFQAQKLTVDQVIEEFNRLFTKINSPVRVLSYSGVQSGDLIWKLSDRLPVYDDGEDDEDYDSDDD